MASTKPGLFRPASKTPYHVICVILLQFLVKFSQGQGPGTTFTVSERSPVNTPVGRINTTIGYTYRLLGTSKYFALDGSTGTITTKLVIDRESLANESISNDIIHLLIIGSSNQNNPSQPIDVYIEVKDVNDNNPVFEKTVFQMPIPENSHKGFQRAMITATDADKGANGNISNYQIISGNEENRFKLIQPSSETPIMFLEVRENLDRETKDFYQLNISATDGGTTPLHGYLRVDITVTDTNDNNPTFNPSEFEAKINESAPVDSTVITVHASDADKGLNSEIVYRLTDETTDQFMIEERTGEIKTMKSPLSCNRVCARSITRCIPNSCLFTVEASDRGSPSLLGRAYMTVIINDENDHDPVITISHRPDKSKDFSTVDENVPVNKQVAAISVIDEDSGENGRTTVSILGGNDLGHFMIMPLPRSTISLIRVIGDLDRERVSMYNLTIKAVDHGYPQRSSIAHLIIYVSDANDHAPVFEKREYRVKMSELELPGSFVASVTASDEDSGPNSALSYSIVAGNNLNWFRIDSKTGLVTTQDKIDHERTNLVIMNVSAKDAGAQIFQNYTTLIVDILDENDITPTFDKDEYDKDISEDIAPGSDIITLTAVDGDDGINGTVRYSFHPSVDRSYPYTFDINTISGRIQTAKKLDRETISRYIVRVIANDGGTPSLSSTATVTINLIDVNDNSPSFRPQQYFISILEKQSLNGADVVQVTAFDPDEGINRRITYSFFGDNYSSFSISNSSGRIRTTRRLSRNRSPYILTVRATDGGGKIASLDARVEVTVASDADALPVFGGASYTFAIVEDGDNQITDISRSVGQVRATVPGGGSVTYAIVGGDPYGVFSIDSSGRVTAVKKVDREIQSEYHLTVIANGGHRFQSTKVKIEVTDINDNLPLFVDNMLETSVLENWPVGRNIYHAEARDADAGANSDLTYTLTSSTNNVFMIKPKTGVIYVNKPLDQLPMNRKNHVLRVTATDAGTPQLSTFVDITVHIEDVNDHNPVFSGHYERSIRESKPVNEPIITLIAVDDDMGRNGDLFYNITRGNLERKFGIFPDGTLYVAHALDREERDIYSLSVAVTDQGIQPRSSVANITFHILDDNDNKPHFSNETYDFYVRENMPLRTFIGSVRATDADIGRNAEIIFSVADTQQNFSINAQTGEIFTLKSFDRESLQETMGRDYYTFDVTATDNGLKRLHENAVVRVHVTDDNDNPPIFSRQIYSGSISENAQSDIRITTVTASDVDIGENGAISYTFMSGNEDRRFRIDETTGEVSVFDQLDREKQDHYSLIILATDSVELNRRLSATATLYITVTDYNDNTPAFVSPPTGKDILESAQPGELITNFMAEDADISNNAVLFYDITQGNGGSSFNLDRYTGKLYLNKPLDYETAVKHTLVVTVADAGQPSRSTSTTFTVDVLDVNDNAPQFSSGPISARMSEDFPKGRKVAEAKAYDADSGLNSEISYSIIQQDPPGNNFNINPANGDISVNEMVDREVSELYTIIVMATDKAADPRMRLSSKKSVSIMVDDVNDNTPKFTSPNTFAVPSTQTRSVIGQVQAEDPDVGENGRVTFSLVSGDRSIFSVTSTGQLNLLKNFPVSSHKYSLTIRAEDHGSDGGKSATMDFTVLVKSTSDDGPRFSQPSYSGSIRENRQPDTNVVRIQATASQPGVPVEYYVTQISGSKGRLFDIDKTTGWLTTAQILDREKLPETITVEIYAAEIGGSSPRTRSTQAQIQIIDENDTPPHFSSTLFSRNIMESVPQGQSVLEVDVEDPDTIGTTQLSLNGDGANDFSISQDGTLRTAKRLSRSLRRTYAFRVQASDGKQTSASDIQIMVDDENDHIPEFSQSFYSFDVPEDTSIGTTVAEVTATDKDEAENGQVTYELVSDWGRDKFQIEGALGTISLIDQLNFEEVQLYTLKVCAKDGGASPQSSTTTVFINVKDFNDNMPVFDPMSYSREVKEDVPIGTPLLNVSATDIDSGINSKIHYSLAGGDKKNQFDIGTLNGTIFTTSRLDREDIPTYDLIVIATDQAEPPSNRLSTSATVNIHLLDVNDRHPEFHTPNATYVKEDAKHSSVVFTVVAVDEDSGSNGEVRYSMGSVPGFGYPFTIDPNSGQLKVNTALDRETVANYTLSITATDRGQPSLSSTQSLTVHIEDVNDNPPAFLQNKYGKTVPEDIGVGKSLLKVSAHDLDEGLNGIVRYYIIDGDNNYDFNLDMSSGELRVQKNLDYERDMQYTLIVQAEDSGVHVVLSATATIVINVTDVNDNKPVFVDSPYIAFVQENTLNLPVHMMQVTARDDDSPPNSQLTYSILEDKKIFQIDSSSGEITVHQTLDRESKAEYKLIVVAKDSGSPSLSGTGTIQVLVQDVNDHAPIFDNTHYTGHVMENKPSDTPVLSVQATDKDEGENAEILYSLQDSMGEKFTIYPDTGQIVTLAMLDREELDVYNLVVIATDRGIPPQSVTTNVMIHIDDDNDNAPDFEQSDYVQQILDQTASGVFILGVTAVDRDINSNGKVIYSLAGVDANRFVINRETGVITAGQIISGVGARFSFSVRATDQGTRPLSKTVNVQVDVVRATASKPQFSPFDQNLSIKENSPFGKSLTTVFATTSRTNQILYYIAGGNVNRGFGINQLNGTISVSGTIDYETTQSFELWIEAEDGGNPPLAVHEMMRVRVEDVNDNTPRFKNTFYNTSINENVVKGTPVQQVSATDLDSNKNGVITYSIKSGNTNSTFRIDGSSGLISTNNIVDREGIDLYHLIVHATDQGSPSLTATATVTVHILDLNDNPPKFTRIYSLFVPENVPINTFIVQVSTSDKDIGDNAKSTFQLLGQSDKFTIDSSSGNISTLSLLDAETNDRYNAKVAAIDDNYRVETNVLILVADVNDNAPEFVEDTLSFDFQERQSPNTVIGRLRATDADKKAPNNQFIFSLKRPSDMFEVNAETGDIIALNTFHYRHVPDHPLSVNRYALDVVVIDLGTPSMSSENMVIITITDANNYPPKFVEDSYFSAVPENTPVGDHVVTVLAVDENDFGINAQVFYAITGGNGTQFFQIDEDTGSITIKSSLQGHQHADYVITVKAEDKGLPPLSSTVEAHFRVTDVNNYAPVFSTRVFQKTFAENARIGQVLQTFLASDRDPGVNGEVIYLITSGNEAGQFHMDKSGGVLSIAKTLDYDTQRTHYLNITARDKALLYKQVTRVFTLQLTDVNDNPPVFNQTSYDAYIPENSPPATSFFTLHATDADSGTNAVINYSIVGTNTHFIIEKETGILRSQGSLDYEIRDSYTLSIMAYNPNALNGETFTMKTVVAVHVHVVGVNEYFPQFEKHRYDFRVSESAAINASIGSVLATDQDKGIDGIVYYFLIGSSNLKGFRIDHQTGVIHVAGRPDYESSPQIVLTVMAKNWGSIQGNDTDTCQVNISIEDANDPPVFSQNEYLAKIDENSGANTFVITVSATDNDIRPENRNFVYTLLSGNTGSRFKIDSTSGVIRTTGQGILDREAVSQYNVTVGAVDSGVPPQTGSVLLKVQLKDVNDNSPFFDPTVPVGHVKENRPIGEFVNLSLIQFTNDLDLPPNQAPYRYKLTSPSSQFEVREQTGRVSTLAVLDRETVSEFGLQVVVTDGGNPTMTSTLGFKVVVDDENDNPPEARPLTIKLMTLRGMSPLGKIADVRPLDKDITGNYSCSIVNGDEHFSIYQNCDLRVTKSLSSNDYNLGISGSDGVQNHQPATYSVSVSVSEYTNLTVDQSVPMLLGDLSSNTFLDSKYTKFISAVKSAFSAYSPVLYSLKEMNKDLIIFLAVRKPNGDYVRKESLQNTLTSKKPSIELTGSVNIKSVSYTTCHSSQCKNGGSCDSTIIMHQGYNINDSPKFILSSAQPEVRSFCSCPPSFTGEHCEIPMGPCGDSYCYNGGTCKDEVCHCTPQWDGPSCQDDVDECLNDPCKNGGTCVNLDGSFRCDCPDGFHGDVCESTLYCTSIPCLNGGSCRDIPGWYVCDCLYGYFGSRCEKSSKGFAEGSYLEYPPLSNLNNTDISLFFATIKSNALLFLGQVTFNPSDHGFVALEIIGGKVRFSYKFTSEAPKRLQVNASVSDGQWHWVQVQKVTQGAVLKVMSCPNNNFSACQNCTVEDAACHNTYLKDLSFPVVQTVRGVSIGGVKDFINVLQYNGDVESHDFVGCIHSYEVNGINMLDTNVADDHKGISNTCPRQSAGTRCSCQNGVCVDEWERSWCSCRDNFMGDNCDEEWKPFTFTPSVIINYKVRESVRRDYNLAAIKGRRRRSVDSSTFSITFRTTKSTGNLLYFEMNNKNAYLWVENNVVKFKMVDGSGSSRNPLSLNKSVTNGKWYNITVTAKGSNYTMDMDSTAAMSGDFGSPFNFASVDVTVITLSGERTVPGSSSIPGFDGCILSFLIDGDKIEFSGKNGKYEIDAQGMSDSSKGCEALCENNPCGEGKTCSVDGADYVCALIDSGGGLQVGVIIVICFFTLLIIAIVIVFIIFKRRGMCQRNCLKSPTKANGSLGNTLGGSQENPDSGYVENPNDDIIGNHITSEMMLHKSNSLTTKPDLIGSNVMGRALPQPVELEDGTVIVENGGGMAHMQPYDENMPECYDLENASSIAPSDIDITAHYRHLRNGQGPKLKNNHPLYPRLHHARHGDSPLTYGANGRPGSVSPSMLKPHSSGYHNPNSMNGSAVSVPARNSPHVPNIRRPNSAQAVMRSSPHHHNHRNSPLNNLQMRNTPLSNLHSSRSNSAHSLGSHHSHTSSSSSAPRIPPSHFNKPLRHGKKHMEKGLTVEEINRLNARPDKMAPVSMAEALSSSSGDRKYRGMRLEEQLDSGVLLEPPDSSSEDSGANDSFTCSEFEYDNDRTRNDFDQGLIFSKLPDVHETDENPPDSRVNSDGMDSNGDSFTSTVASSEDTVFNPNQRGNGTFNFDALLNWGPNFDKLVGVFKDIALLPDNEKQTLEGVPSNDYEEYV